MTRAVKYVIGGLILLTIVVAGSIHLWGKYKENKLQKDIDARQEEVIRLQGEKDQLQKDITNIQVQRQALEAQVTIQQTVITATGKKVEEAKKGVIDENTRFEKDSTNANGITDRVSVCEDLCTRAKRAGLYPKDKPCGCQ